MRAYACVCVCVRAMWILCDWFCVSSPFIICSSIISTKGIDEWVNNEEKWEEEIKKKNVKVKPMILIRVLSLCSVALCSFSSPPSPIPINVFEHCLLYALRILAVSLIEQGTEKLGNGGKIDKKKKVRIKSNNSKLSGNFSKAFQMMDTFSRFYGRNSKSLYYNINLNSMASMWWHRFEAIGDLQNMNITKIIWTRSQLLNALERMRAQQRYQFIYTNFWNVCMVMIYSEVR